MTAITRLAHVARALRAARAAARHERLAPPALRALQQERLDRIVRHAAARSPVYRDLYRGIDLSGRVDLARLPPVDKSTLMGRFDDWVTDPRLRLAGLEAHLASLGGDDLLFDEYRVCATGGTSGRRGMFVFSRAEWMTGLAGGFRWTAWIGATPRLPRLRLAQVAATSPLHMTARFSLTLDVGVHRVLRLDARRPVAELAAALAAFRPDVMSGYPSILALLADEQLAGRLAIAPRTVTTTSEVRTPEMEERIVAAWGVRPFNLYASTETGVIAVDCEHHTGLHLFEDYVLVENVAADGRPVPDGQPGSRLLLTNLFNHTQPIVRYELSDIATIESAPCGCGRAFRRIVALDGRSDDVLLLPGRDGREVAVHPLAIRSPFASLTEVGQYQVVHEGSLRVRAVPREGVSPAQVTRRIQSVLATKLAELGVAPLPIEVEIVAALARDAGHSGKLKLIESRPMPAGASSPAAGPPGPVSGSARTRVAG
jgi:phenylacetate-CoA ligase